MARRKARGDDHASLFLRLEELVLANSGEDEFEEILKLLYAKLWDEIKNSGRAFKPGQTDAETAAVVNELLYKAAAEWPGIFPPGTQSQLTCEHLAICVALLQHRNILDGGLAVMDAAFEHLVGKVSKGAKGQYFTPRHIIQFCVNMVDPHPGDLVADPACGSGGFLIHTLKYVQERHEHLRAPKAAREYCARKLWGFDFEQRAYKVAKALMLVLGDGSANIIRLNSLLKPNAAGKLFRADQESQVGTSIEDVMRLRCGTFDGFDILLTNPPFAGEIREKDLLEDYEIYRLRRRVIERDALFLERCIELLKPGGRLAIILPDNKVTASAWQFLRQWLLSRARVLAVVSLGRTAFLPHTSQKTSILFCRRRAKGERPSDRERIFFAISERTGKDSKGRFLFRPGAETQAASGNLWEILDHDLSEVLSTYREHRSQEPVNEV